MYFSSRASKELLSVYNKDHTTGCIPVSGKRQTLYFNYYLLQLLKGAMLMLFALPAYLPLSQALLISSLPLACSLHSLTNFQMPGGMELTQKVDYLHTPDSATAYRLGPLLMKCRKIQVWAFQAEEGTQPTSPIAWKSTLDIKLLNQKLPKSLPTSVASNKKAHPWI